MDTILYPIMWLVAWIMYGIHKGLTTFFGMDAGAGPAWVISILGLTVLVRLLVLPLFNKQIKASRQTQILQPEIQKIQKKYKGKKDPVSQQRQQEELSALYRKHGTSPFASCMPMLIQMPVLFSLFRVFYAFPRIAEGSYGHGNTLGPITQEVAQQFQSTTFFGAPLSASFSQPGDPSHAVVVRIVAAILVLFMCVSMFYTQKQLTMKNMPESAMDSDNPIFRTQKYMLYGMPVIYLFSGVAFQIGVLLYWTAGNLWNIGQQTWFIRNNPTPGSKAFREREERLRKKRLRKGLSEEEIAELEAQESRGGQRQQPLGKARSKKAAAQQRANALLDPTSVVDDADESGEDAEVRGKDGLTDAERARKRYERRQAERARSRAKAQNRQKKAQRNQKPRNF
ncbi:membrane protein insertase YidC [Arcanobacterium haemolyticum]|nr:membrane protein insertase YidC [Arcanobacterium haemolyticum]